MDHVPAEISLTWHCGWHHRRIAPIVDPRACYCTALLYGKINISGNNRAHQCSAIAVQSIFMFQIIANTLSIPNTWVTTMCVDSMPHTYEKLWQMSTAITFRQHDNPKITCTYIFQCEILSNIFRLVIAVHRSRIIQHDNKSNWRKMGEDGRIEKNNKTKAYYIML